MFTHTYTYHLAAPQSDTTRHIHIPSDSNQFLFSTNQLPNIIYAQGYRERKRKREGERERERERERAREIIFLHAETQPILTWQCNHLQSKVISIPAWRNHHSASVKAG